MFRKRGSYKDFEEYVFFKTGKRLQELNKDAHVYEIKQMERAAELLRWAKKEGIKVLLYGDYDSDGITSCAQLAMLLRDLEIFNCPYIPKRGVDGYGIYRGAIEALPPSYKMVITVDNGITAIDALQCAKERSMKILILDHHIADTENGKVIYPPHDVLIDPDLQAAPEGSEFHDYCGSGLSFKLWAFMIHNCPDLFYDIGMAKQHFMQCAAFAAIGTIADVVPVLGDNRKIVRAGLSVINSRKASVGLNSLVMATGLDGHLTSTDIAFSIAPVINAAGRMNPKGGEYAWHALLETDEVNAAASARALIDENDKRKALVSSLYDAIIPDTTAPVNFIRCNGREGILGLIAAKLTNDTGKPSFVYTCHDGRCTGSARSDDETTNDVAAMLKSCGSLIQSGGHTGAAGFRFDVTNEDAVREALYQCQVAPHTDVTEYDLEIPDRADAIHATLQQMSQAEPFGKGIEQPIYRVVVPMNGKTPHPLGKDGKHVSFKDGPTKFVGFNLQPKFFGAHLHDMVAFYGTLSYNTWRGVQTPQFMFTDFEQL